MGVTLFDAENGHFPWLWTNEGTIPWTTQVASHADWSEKVFPDDELWLMAEETGPDRQCPADKDAYIGMNYFTANKTDSGSYSVYNLIAPLVYEYYQGYSTPITFEDIHDPSSWMMQADVKTTPEDFFFYGYHQPTFFAYTLLTWGNWSDSDGDGIADTGAAGQYNGFAARAHSGGVPLSLCDGHVEVVDFESLWESKDNQYGRHKFWWDGNTETGW